MRLTVRNLHTYLLDKGFIDAATLASGDYMVTQTQTRNSIFKVFRKHQKSLFVKQLNAFDSNNTYVLQKDATCLWLIKNEPVFKRLSKYVPEYFGYDTERQVLITEYLPDAINLHDYMLGRQDMEAHLWDQLVAILCSFHFNASDAIKTNRSAQFLPRQIPWALGVADMSGPHMQSLSSSTNPNPVIQIIQSNPGFVHLITNIRNNWVYDSLIHGDIKWMNLLIHDFQKSPKLKLIDWEIADFGDPLWDVAGVFSAVLTHELLYKDSTRYTQNYTPIQTGLNDMKDAWPVIGRFWAKYLEKRKPGQQPADVALAKCIQYTGGRLIQSAIEYNMSYPQIQPTSTRLLQASYSVLENHATILKLLSETEKLVEA